jgi:hypothetical protein
MGLLKKLLGSTSEPDSDRPWEARPQWMVDGMKVTLLEGGTQTLECVGESHYQDSIHRIVESLAEPDHYGHRGDEDGVRVPLHGILVAETNNPYDSNAISVWISGHKVGHLPRDAAEAYRPGLLKLQKEHGQPIALDGAVIGRPGLYGVFLKNDPEDFGLPRGMGATVPPPPGARLRTGLSEAIGTDEEDDSYDLSWLDDLPGDTIKRIPKLRKLIEEDPDPIDRHFMFTQLEKDLYSCRDLWPTALDEYDTVAEQHHSEMVDGMREALLGKFGKVPLIETYKQAAIRQQKARNWESSLCWVERGLEIYGDEPARAEAVEDLEKRVERARSKLEKP